MNYLLKNKNIRKTFFNVIILYLTTTFSLVIILSYLYIKQQKDELKKIKKEQTNIASKYLIEQLELLHKKIIYKNILYPTNIQSALFDIDKNLIFSTFKEQIDLNKFKDNILQTDKNLFFLYKIEPFYLGGAYLVIKTDNIKYNISKIIILDIIILTFLIISSFIIAKIVIKPLSDNFIQLDKFIKDTTHELNTPISIILNNIEMFDTTSLSKSNIKKLNRIKLGAKTISLIYNDLSFLLLNNKQKSFNQNINISEILIQRIEFFTILAESKHIKFQTNIQDNIIIFIDKLKIQKLFDNLISNSIKYSFNNSTINIILKDNYFSIQDYGYGIKKEDIKNIFTRYKRFNNNVGGFGIGYNIIYSIIKEYNIKINIISEINKGTKVELIWQK